MAYFAALPDYYIISAAGCNKRILQELQIEREENCDIFVNSIQIRAHFLCLDKQGITR